jgi:hypothetical protein
LTFFTHTAADIYGEIDTEVWDHIFRIKTIHSPLWLEKLIGVASRLRIKDKGEWSPGCHWKFKGYDFQWVISRSAEWSDQSFLTHESWA